MLIYIPPSSRAGIAVLICAVSVANLNFFQPHKNKVLFWLSQISFLTTLAKYTMALLLALLSTDEQEERQIMGLLLIVLDVSFMSWSILSIFISLWVLRMRIREINKESKDDEHNSASSRGRRIGNTQVLPQEMKNIVKSWDVTKANTTVTKNELEECSVTNGNNSEQVMFNAIEPDYTTEVDQLEKA